MADTIQQLRGVGAPPGRDGKDGVGIALIEQIDDARMRVTLDNKAIYVIALPRGRAGPTPFFRIGNVTPLLPGDTPFVEVRETAVLARYLIDFGIPPGPTGAPATLVPGTVTTGAPGSAAAANVTAHPTIANAYVLSLTLPQGQQGVQGIQGLQGIQGPQGGPGPAGNGTGNVIGPGASTTGNLFAFGDGTGTSAVDSGVSARSLADDAFINTLIFGG